MLDGWQHRAVSIGKRNLVGNGSGIKKRRGTHCGRGAALPCDALRTFLIHDSQHEPAHPQVRSLGQRWNVTSMCFSAI